jgi:glycogen operon protein
VRFVQSLTALRRRYPILRRNRFLSTVVNEAIGVKEVAWINTTGAEMRAEDWNGSRCFGMLLDGRAQATGIKQRGQDATMLLIMNSHHDEVLFTLPAAGDDHELARWSLLLDTQFSEPAHTVDNEYAAGDHYTVTARSLLLLKLKLPPEAPLWSEQR